jgi:hypothetical protein
MALSYKPADGTRVIVASAGTVVEAGVQPYDNTHTVVILNNTTGVDGYARWQSDGTAMTPATCMVIPGGSSLTLSIGVLSQRPADGATLRFDGANAVTFQLTYVNGMDS